MPNVTEGGTESWRPWNTIFICTGNSARSIMAEALMRDLGDGRFRSFSAGTRPAGAPHPLALETLARHGHDTRGLSSKHLDPFLEEGAPQMDFIFTVCDSAAGEACAIWPGRPASAHWGIPDPAAAEGDIEARRQAFEEAYQRLRARIDAFLALPDIAPDKADTRQALVEIGKMDG